ncbi:hypothetical protein QH494_10040 [Sphingomonas sp. AR_OL41]|uniref:hypothetical protein n=1 Tax=Sphingomonas sp. AR_OL41 TaxID=3042729 RepID=UPI002480DF9E|nr:hypothetical protein [Sphingomonas sp. AR_OL41]MDH7972522.1 hypothetical protein [Sphingomonas sp. AR_OL41]
MIDEALVDTDVLFKTVSYRLAHATLRHLVECGMRPRVLGAARFMLVAYVERGRRVRDVAAVAAELALIEPMLDDCQPAWDLDPRSASNIDPAASILPMGVRNVGMGVRRRRA